MAIPKSAYPPPFNVTRASHVVMTSRDLGAARAFYVDTLGLVVSDEDARTLYLRGLEEACHHSLVIRKADEAVCQRVGMRVYAESDLEAAFDILSRQSIPCHWAEVPHQGKTLHFNDASGAPIELCARMDVKPRLVVAFDQHRAGAPHRLDHFQILTPDVQAAADFYTGIGFRLSEYVAVDGSDDLVFIFLQRKGNPHDIVFANGSGPRLHHFAYTVPNASHIIHACDVAGRIGFSKNVEYGPGRHGPGHALFVYFRDPDGHRVELFTTHYQCMDIENEPVRWDVSYLANRPWGFPPRERWYEEASPFSGVAPKRPARRAGPATLESMLGTGARLGKL